MSLFTRGSTIILLAGDLAIFAGALLLTLLVRYRSIPSAEVIDQHLTPFTMLFFVWLLVYMIVGLYDKKMTLARKNVPGVVFRAQFINTLIAVLFFFLFPFAIEPKTNLVIYLLISSVLISFWRLYVFPSIVSGKTLRVLTIGSGPEATAIAQTFSSNPFYRNVQSHSLDSGEIEDIDLLRQSLIRSVEESGVDLIIADMRDPRIEQLSQDFYTLVFTNQHVQFFNLPTVYEQLHHRIPPSLIGETWFLENVTTGSPHYAYDVLKRTVDILGALVLFIPFAIFFPFIALAIKLGDGGPLFYVTERVGLHNAMIKIIKFRTMTGRDSGDAALKSDLKVTRVGKILRKSRLDELPQLINVLRGDLSFIGPRPEMPALASVYAEEIPYYNLRHLIKPGLSGWAQINNFDAPRAGVDIPRTVDKLSFDLYYLKHRSFLLDMETALKTIDTVLQRTGT